MQPIGGDRSISITVFGPIWSWEKGPKRPRIGFKGKKLIRINSRALYQRKRDRGNKVGKWLFVTIKMNFYWSYCEKFIHIKRVHSYFRNQNGEKLSWGNSFTGSLIFVWSWCTIRIFFWWYSWETLGGIFTRDLLVSQNHPKIQGAPYLEELIIGYGEEIKDTGSSIILSLLAGVDCKNSIMLLMVKFQYNAENFSRSHIWLPFCLRNSGISFLTLQNSTLFLSIAHPIATWSSLRSSHYFERKLIQYILPFASS